MNHKQNHSKNWKKAKAKVLGIHTHFSNAQYDYLHKATTTISQDHAMVIIEDLQVSNMSKSARGSAPNSRVKTRGPRDA